MTATPLLLEVRHLTTTFPRPAGEVVAVDRLSLALRRGESLALVGESGSGKSVTALSLMRLVMGGHISGHAWMDLGDGGPPRDLLALDERAMQKVRGRHLGMVFQEPMSSLNPLRSVGDQIAEVMRVHGLATARQARFRALALMMQVGLPEPELRMGQFPHQLSGGMRQRVMIAMALAGNPALLIADEPTTALDVTVQAQILRLLRQVQRSFGMGLLFVSHDLGVVAQVADRVAVMYAGQVIESANVVELYARPRHPYTRALLAAVARPGMRSRLRGDAERPEPPEQPAQPGIGLPRCCRYIDHCPRVQTRCRQERPLLVGPESHAVRCFFPLEAA